MMNALKTLLILSAILAANSAIAQSGSHLTLSNDQPVAGEKISFSYDPSGTIVDGKTDITASVYFLDNKKYPVSDINLKPDGKLFTGDFTIPAATKAFFIKISSGDNVDNNNDKGYVYLIYKNKQPIEGAYAMDAELFLPTAINYYSRIKKDPSEGVRLFKKEFELYPNGDKDYVTFYYSVIAKMPDYKEMINTKISELLKSTNEQDLDLASTLLRGMKKNNSADSLDAIIYVKFPNETFAKSKLFNAFYQEQDAVKKDSLYNVYMQKFPPMQEDKQMTEDNFRVRLAAAYLNKGDMINFRKYESQIKDKTNLEGELNNIAYEWAKKGEHLDDAQMLSKESLDIVAEKIKNPQPASFASLEQVKKNAQYSYDIYADTYAFVLAKENKFPEALQYEQPVVDHLKAIDPEIYGNYINILNGNGMDAKATLAEETVVKAGQGTTAIKEELKKSYVKTHGNDNGFDQYVTGLEKTSKDKAADELAKSMINQPAHAFTLTDLDGKTVSLADLKGKVVIVDFWATWCGPCKASFPGMQLAVNKYKDDPNVKFLFVDTWENGENYSDGVKKFITANKYTFHVLLDDKNAEGRQGKVVTDYGVEGIPTKFIIDKDGNIRFKYVGYAGTPEKLVEEVTQMVDMAQNPGGAASVQPASNAKSGSK